MSFGANLKQIKNEQCLKGCLMVLTQVMVKVYGNKEHDNGTETPVLLGLCVARTSNAASQVACYHALRDCFCKRAVVWCTQQQLQRLLSWWWRRIVGREWWAVEILGQTGKRAESKEGR